MDMMDEWTCRKCTLINGGDRNYCKLCHNPKPRWEPGLPNVAIPPLIGTCHTDQQRDEWTCGNCTLINSDDRNYCKLCDNPKPRREPDLPNVANPHTIGTCHTDQQKDEWTCGKSTLINSEDRHYCEACDNPKPRREAGLPNVTNQYPIGPYHTDQQREGPLNERRIVLLGRTESGKSATANNILGEKVFESSTCGSSVTKVCQRGRASRCYWDIQVIDTPGLFDTGMTHVEITREVVKCVGMTAPGPHAFVFVVRIDRFTQEEQNTVDHFRQVFGRDMLNYLIVLFTRKDDLIDDNKSLHDYLENVPAHLQALIKSCHNRCIAFNNKGSDAEKKQDVKDFITLVDQVFLDNGGKCYTSEMYVEAEKNMKMREEQLRREQEQKIQEERNAIRREFERKLQMKHDEDADMRKQLEERIKTLERERKPKMQRRKLNVIWLLFQRIW